MDHNCFHTLRFRDIYTTVPNQFFRITTAMATGGTTLTVEMEGSFPVIPGEFWSRQSVANNVDTVINWRNTYPYIAESIYNAWNMAGTLVVYDLIERRLPRAVGTSRRITNVDQYPVLSEPGAVASGTGTLTLTLPTGAVAGDLALMFLETAGQTITCSGWTQHPGSPVTVSGNETRLTVLYRVLTGTNNLTTNDSGDHQIGFIIVVKAGTFDAASPFGSYRSNLENSAITSHTWNLTGFGVTNAKSLILLAASGDTDIDSDTFYSAFSTTATQWLNEIGGIIGVARANGNGGALGLASGYVGPAAVFTGNATYTTASACRGANLALVIKSNPNQINYVEWDFRKAMPDLPTGLWTFALRYTYLGQYVPMHFAREFTLSITNGVVDDGNSDFTNGSGVFTFPTWLTPTDMQNMALLFGLEVVGGNLRARYDAVLNWDDSPVDTFESVFGCELILVGSYEAGN